MVKLTRLQVALFLAFRSRNLSHQGFFHPTPKEFEINFEKFKKKIYPVYCGHCLIEVIVDKYLCEQILCNTGKSQKLTFKNKGSVLGKTVKINIPFSVS